MRVFGGRKYNLCYKLRLERFFQMTKNVDALDSGMLYVTSLWLAINSTLTCLKISCAINFHCDVAEFLW